MIANAAKLKIRTLLFIIVPGNRYSWTSDRQSRSLNRFAVSGFRTAGGEFGLLIPCQRALFPQD
jgi:hypothetical protein